MKKNFTPLDESNRYDSHLITTTVNSSENILAIENNQDQDEDLMDFDFDYDPNEMYYALLNHDESIS